MPSRRIRSCFYTRRIGRIPMARPGRLPPTCFSTKRSFACIYFFFVIKCTPSVSLLSFLALSQSQIVSSFIFYQGFFLTFFHANRGETGHLKDTYPITFISYCFPFIISSASLSFFKWVKWPAIRLGFE